MYIIDKELRRIITQRSSLTYYHEMQKLKKILKITKERRDYYAERVDREESYLIQDMGQ